MKFQARKFPNVYKVSIYYSLLPFKNVKHIIHILFLFHELVLFLYFLMHENDYSDTLPHKATLIFSVNFNVFVSTHSFYYAEVF